MKVSRVTPQSLLREKKGTDFIMIMNRLLRDVCLYLSSIEFYMFFHGVFFFKGKVFSFGPMKVLIKYKKTLPDRAAVHCFISP